MKKIKILILVTVLFSPVFTFGADYYAVDKTKPVQINEHGICKKVSVGNDIKYFVPTKTKLEWQAFIDNKPSSVSLAACSATTSTTTTATTTSSVDSELAKGKWFNVTFDYTKKRMPSCADENDGGDSGCSFGASSRINALKKSIEEDPNKMLINGYIWTVKNFTSCTDYCKEKDLMSWHDSDGNYCASGECRPSGFQGGSDKYQFGKWGNTSQYDGKKCMPNKSWFCYKQPSPTIDNDKTDFITGCFCKSR